MTGEKNRRAERTKIGTHITDQTFCNLIEKWYKYYDWLVEFDKGMLIERIVNDFPDDVEEMTNG